jgi:dynactin complex subunit
MLAAKNDTARYNTEMNVYLDCLKAATDKLTPADTSKLSAEQKKKMDEQAKVLVAKNNAAVDELQAVVGRFNDQLKAYKAAHATPAPAQ